MSSSAQIHSSANELIVLNELIQQIKDWDYCLNRCIGPLFYTKIPQLSNFNLMPHEIKDKLQQSYYLTLSRRIMMCSVYQKAINALTSNRMEVMVVKKTYLA